MSSAAHQSDAIQPSDSQWPQGVSRNPTMSIGTALSVLQQEYPAVTLSKIRFLESQGIVDPYRTPAGYRTYSAFDIERLRFALAAQRDSFLPWAKIRERLAELDAAASDQSQSAALPVPGTRVVTEDGELTAAVTLGRMTQSELAEHAHVHASVIENALSAGLIQPDASGKFRPESIEVVRAVAHLLSFGIDERHLRSLRTRVQRDLDLVEQVTVTQRSSNRSNNKAAGIEGAHELGRALSTLHSASIKQGIASLL